MTSPLHTGCELWYAIKREGKQEVITPKTKIKLKLRHLIGTTFASARICLNQNTVHHLHWNYFTNHTHMLFRQAIRV